MPLRPARKIRPAPVGLASDMGRAGGGSAPDTGRSNAGQTSGNRPDGSDWHETRDRVEHYFDRTATDVWTRLTSDADVSWVRRTVRAGRDEMRALILSRLPDDLSGMRILDAGCGVGQLSQALAERGAEVVAVDISESLLDVARTRLPDHLAARVEFRTGDLRDDAFGRFDHVVAMDSLLYYDALDICSLLADLSDRTEGKIVFTVAPRTPLLTAMWGIGRLFPKSDRSPVMIPHAPRRLARHLERGGCVRKLSVVDRISSGFYISTCLEVAT
ncbi:magnesium protoporphyrin IX methyltransferase [Palleronia abyssalis]|uniref:Magnesium protoporphyrin IX methyltransferase n=1 Tax=Palleronia abyssalis TaxID=1501240 RepID=A0A2R8BWX4_9RHOB|nr:magnesium protoporphyrin IX methyltransferase [Palleronia abyssalis]SPJ24667.1 Magnesium-protoporphyrin O-methyltransferase [Palleronia abyssalis]